MNLKYCFEDDFTGVEINEIPVGWSRDRTNWA